MAFLEKSLVIFLALTISHCAISITDLSSYCKKNSKLSSFSRVTRLKSGYIPKNTRLKIAKISTFSKKKPQCLVLALDVENLGKPFVRNQFYDDLYYILPSNPLKLPIQQYIQCQAFQLILVESDLPYKPGISN